MTLTLKLLRKINFLFFLVTRNVIWKIKFFYNIFFLKKNLITILHVGQIHSPHFLLTYNNIVKDTFDERFYVLNYLMCSYPVISTINVGIVYDLFNYRYKYRKTLDEWDFKLFNYAENVIECVSKRIEKIIRTKSVNLIWIHDLQSGGYLFLDVMNILDNKIPVVATTYGNDLYFFKDIKSHNFKISQLLSRINLLHVETIRDINIATNEFNYNGLIAKNFSATGHVVNLGEHDDTYDGDKDIYLLIKGSYKYRSTLIDFFRLIESNYSFLLGKKIVIFGGSDEDFFWALKLRDKFQLDIECCRFIKHSDVMNLMGRSKYHLSLTLSDGMANTCKESVIKGCLPIITVHNGFSEIIPEGYKKFLVHEPNNLYGLFPSLHEIDSSHVLRSLILKSLVVNVNDYYSKIPVDAFKMQLRLLCFRNLNSITGSLPEFINNQDTR
jgi:hypothetical protein